MPKLDIPGGPGENGSFEFAWAGFGFGRPCALRFAMLLLDLPRRAGTGGRACGSSGPRAMVVGGPAAGPARCVHGSAGSDEGDWCARYGNRPSGGDARPRGETPAHAFDNWDRGARARLRLAIAGGGFRAPIRTCRTRFVSSTSMMLVSASY